MENKDVNRIQKRLHILYLCILCFIFLLVGRLFQLQIFDARELIGKNNAQVEVDRKLQSPRGTIYDRNGNPLAMSMMTKSLYADPAMIKKTPEEIAELLAPYVTIPKVEIASRLRQDTAFVWLDRMMDPDKSKAVQEIMAHEGLEGLNFVEESRRFYPNSELAAQVLGFVGTDDKGLDGLEMVLDDTIRGTIAEELIATDAKGNAIFGSVMSKFLPNKGKSVTLTLDSTVQFIAERALDTAMATTKPAHASVIIMDPKTGEILALANRPTYDPNHYEKGSKESFKNIAVTNLYEPGSTFKPIIASAALASNKWSLDTVYHDVGYIKTNDHVMKNWNGEGYGDVRLLDILKFSINTGMAKIGITTGPKILVDYVKKFGFGQPTGIELPGEGEGILFEADQMADVDTASMSIGQSIAVTPLQMVRAFGAIANGGKMMKPHIIKSYNNSDGSVVSTTEPEEVGQPIPSSVAQTIVDILEKEVSEGGGHNAMVEGYHFAGKTGTAQKLNTEYGGYLDGRYIASFIGFGPVEDPRFVALVVIDDPSQGSIYGGQIAAPVFKDIMSQLVRYYQISPSVREQEKTTKVEKRSLPTVTKQGNERIVIPDFTGYSFGEVRQWLHEAGLAFIPDGTGYAVSQDIPAGTEVTDDETVRVVFSH
ncbi:penicillin-binding protein [Veillonella montpellierensis DNF00314]|uniref:Penicillin-binding protein n=1 Tax=Veillonella montpellierensis DNF00314 TaxID=1401067 RepID=A0A096AJC9_9FIRM|nr:penicillin-binding transpeptidase domain-containing protein [Veillonella montpellierensis]KGF47203.1 penicillin-binding protein [Veillonella montpellierensis DNF00314]